MSVQTCFPEVSCVVFLSSFYTECYPKLWNFSEIYLSYIGQYYTNSVVIKLFSSLICF